METDAKGIPLKSATPASASFAAIRSADKLGQWCWIDSMLSRLLVTDLMLLDEKKVRSLKRLRYKIVRK